jgi:acyl-CoA reductase-like NAD-dependent aldehyde dehydrogenase/nicotinamidase-related amidase
LNTSTIKPTLLLVDMQNDFLARPGLHPEADRLIAEIGVLLGAFRAASLPVIHVRTLIAADGADSMPHWRRQGIRQCVRGTPGAMPPQALAAADGEEVVDKRFFSGFETGRLDELLGALGADTLVVAGLYTHGCIRATVTDAYQKGYAVIVAADGIASADPQHALASRQWLEERAAQFLANDAILPMIGLALPTAGAGGGELMPAGHAVGIWMDAPELPVWSHFDPCCSKRVLARVPLADATLIDRAVAGARHAGPAWSTTPAAERAFLLNAWAQVIGQNREAWAGVLARQLGKPITDAREEMDRAVAHVRIAAQLVDTLAESHGEALQTRHCARGVIAVITPWNNPVALPVAKIASALVFGNSVVWKPALPAPEVARAIVASLAAAGIPPALLSLVFGDAGTAKALIAHPGVAAVTLTGSQRAGSDAALLCARRGTPLQAELGGNNAAIVTTDADLDATARALAASAFGFAGQRCTATRRIIVEESVRERFTEILLREIAGLRVGDPLDPETRVGPLVSAARREEVKAVVERALAADGGRLLCGGAVPREFEQGGWYLPTLVDNLAPDAALVQQETFGPVAVIQAAKGYDDAIRLCNGIPQGLVASFFGADAVLQRRFLVDAEAGILRLNPSAFPVAADAPFGGWKSSSMGPPEHGRWDREFFARPQAIYGELP